MIYHPFFLLAPSAQQQNWHLKGLKDQRLPASCPFWPVAHRCLLMFLPLYNIFHTVLFLKTSATWVTSATFAHLSGSSCAGQPCVGPLACPTCGTWHCRWAPATPARQWNCSSCPGDASQSGCEPLCGDSKDGRLLSFLWNTAVINPVSLSLKGLNPLAQQ